MSGPDFSLAAGFVAASRLSHVRVAICADAIVLTSLREDRKESLVIRKVVVYFFT